MTIQYDKLSKDIKDVIEKLITLKQKGHGKLELHITDGKIVHGSITESFKPANN